MYFNNNNSSSSTYKQLRVNMQFNRMLTVCANMQLNLIVELMPSTVPEDPRDHVRRRFLLHRVELTLTRAIPRFLLIPRFVQRLCHAKTPRICSKTFPTMLPPLWRGFRISEKQGLRLIQHQQKQRQLYTYTKMPTAIISLRAPQ